MQTLATTSFNKMALRSPRQPLNHRSTSPRHITTVRANMRDNNTNNNNFPAMVAKTASAAALAALLALGSPASPSHAGFDTRTFKAGTGATVENSVSPNESSSETVKKLREAFENAQAKLTSDTKGAGDSIPDAVIKELDTVRSEIDALEKQSCREGDSACKESNVKSLASAIEAQINGLKAIVGFD